MPDQMKLQRQLKKFKLYAILTGGVYHTFTDLKKAVAFADRLIKQDNLSSVAIDRVISKPMTLRNFAIHVGTQEPMVASVKLFRVVKREV